MAVAIATALLSWVFGTSLNPFVTQTNIALILNGAVNIGGQGPWIVLGAFVSTLIVALLGIAYRRRLSHKIKWSELAAMFTALAVTPLIFLELLNIPGMLGLVLFLTGGFGYVLLFVFVYIISKTLGE